MQNIPLYRKGGAIIARGVGHDEKNRIINGGRGIPVVDARYYKKGQPLNLDIKEAEFESKELVITKQQADKVNMLVAKYKECNCEQVLKELGAYFREILASTEDMTCKDKCEFPQLKNIKK